MSGWTSPKAKELSNRGSGAWMLVEAKKTEFMAHLMAGNVEAMEKARVEASAALESHFDAMLELMRECNK